MDFKYILGYCLGIVILLKIICHIFIENNDLEENNKADITKATNAPKLVKKDKLPKMAMENNQGDKIIVNTLNEWLEARKAGYFAKEERYKLPVYKKKYRAKMLAMLKKDALSGDPINLNEITKLPIDMLARIGEFHKKVDDENIGNFLPSTDHAIRSINRQELMVRIGTTTAQIFLFQIAQRGDFNDDGIEDAAIEYNWQSLSGGEKTGAFLLVRNKDNSIAVKEINIPRDGPVGKSSNKGTKHE